MSRRIAYRDTSREAYDRIKPVSGEIDLAIMAALRAHPAGITCEAIEAFTDRNHQTVSGNLRHLVERGFVVASGDYGQTKSGRRAILWIVNKAPAPKPAPGSVLSPVPVSPVRAKQLKLF